MFALRTTGLTVARGARATKTSRRAVSTTIVNRANYVNIARLAPETATRTRTREIAQIAAKKAAPPPPPSKLFTEAQYVNAACLAFGVYAAQMLLIPAKMVSDHFHASADQLSQFWIRGGGVGWAALVWATRQLDVTTATSLMMFTSFAAGVAYPWGAKLNLFKNNLSIKYPMHYVPEALMAILTLAGAYLVYL